jgi:mono/diheme cytochrome c family protein
MKFVAKSSAVASIVFGLLVAAVFLAPASRPAEARPNYKKAFEKKYSKVKGVDCAVCHEGEDKKTRNEYGKAFGAALDGKNVKDAKKIEKALDKTAKEKDADGKPYGDKLKKGEKPVG